jgi:hypothetical protein
MVIMTPRYTFNPTTQTAPKIQTEVLYGLLYFFHGVRILSKKQSEYAIRKLGFPYVVPHAENELRLVAWKSFVDLLEQIGVQRSDRLCASLLLGILVRWREFKVEANRAEVNPWLFFAAKTQQDNQQDLDSELFNCFERKKILKGVQLLEGAGYVHKRRNPRHGYDKTWQYRLDMDVLQQDLESPETALDRVEQRLGGQYLSTVLSFWTLAAKYGIALDEPIEEDEVQKWTIGSPEMDDRWSENGQAIPPYTSPCTSPENGSPRANGEAELSQSVQSLSCQHPYLPTTIAPPIESVHKDVTSRNHNDSNILLAKRLTKDHDLVATVSTFLEFYERIRGEVHPRIRADRMERILDRLRYHEVTGFEAVEIIDRYFAAPLDCDFRLWHFATDGILRNRGYEMEAARPYESVLYELFD